MSTLIESQDSLSASACQPMVRGNIDPDPIAFNWRVCGNCGWRDSCYPKVDFGEGAKVLDDNVLVNKLVQWSALKKDAAEYNRLDKEIKEQLNYQGIKDAIAGPYVIEGKEINRKEYTVKAGSFVRYTIEPVTTKTLDK